MPLKTNESPPRQQDRGGEPGRGPRDEVRNSVSICGQPVLDPDTADDAGFEPVDYPDINTRGSER